MSTPEAYCMFIQYLTSPMAPGSCQSLTTAQRVRFTLYLPSSGVIKALELHLRSGKAPEYVDAGGTLRWQDPSLRWRGPGAGVVSRDYFLGKLASACLEPVWVLAGEKNVYAGHDVGTSMGGFGGGLYHTTAFAMEAGVLKSFGTKTEFQKPSAEQLDKLRAAP